MSLSSPRSFGTLVSVIQHQQLEMAMGTRNPSTRRVLPDKEVGTEGTSYPWVRYWAKSHTHRVCGYGCGCRLPIPVYPRVRKTRINNSHPKSF
jgi:hypothetical protein